MLLIFYALPNGNTIEQTIGKAIKPGDDWHFDIQHIGAQVAFLAGEDQRIATWSSRTWKTTSRAGPRGGGPTAMRGFPKSSTPMRNRFDKARTRIVLSGHSGGGSFIFGYVNSVATIPDQIERIAFLDANYAYQTERHKDKLAAWLTGPLPHYLVVLAYNDAVALLDGKPFVSASGRHLGPHPPDDRRPGRLRFRSRRTSQAGSSGRRPWSGRVTFLLKENPDRKVLHTVQVEKNGFIESLLAGTKLEGVGYTYFGERAYARFIRDD